MARRDQQKSTSRLPAWKLSLFRIAAVTLPVLALEAAARIYWVQAVTPAKTPVELYEQAIGEKVLGDEVPYQFFPNRQFVVATTPTHTNNLALRGDYDIDPEEPYSGSRILCIGDSVTFGYSVSGNQAAYPAVVERRLRVDGIECQVLNGGMPRFRIAHLIKFYRDQLSRYQCGIVVILGGWNNANDHVIRGTGKKPWAVWLNENWYLLRVVRRWKVLPEFGQMKHLPAQIDTKGFERYGRELRQLVAAVRESGATPVLCTLPHFFHNLPNVEAREKAGTFTPAGTFEQLADVADAMNDTIRATGDQLDVPVIELTGIDQHPLFGDAIHPNDAGSAQIAERVAQFLIDNRLLRWKGKE